MNYHAIRLDSRKALIVQSEDLYTTKAELKALTPQSRNYPTRIMVVATTIFLVITVALQANGISWKEFPAKLKQLMHTSVNWKTGIILGSVGLLIGGSTFIIYRVTRGKGKFWGDKHYRPVVLRQARIPEKQRIHWDKRMQPHQQLIDTSLVENGTGKTNSVQRKEDEHDFISFTTLFIAPLQTVAAVAYNAIRFCVVPFYILGRMAQEAITAKPSFEGQRKFKLVDIPKQMALSLYWAARAPFYGVAYMVAVIYSFIDPMGGRKLGQLVTNEWMEGVDRLESVWTWVPVDGYKWEGGGGPKTLGHQAYYWTGCWMPWATVEMKDNNITRAYYPGEIFEYDIYYPEEAANTDADLVRDTRVVFHPLPAGTALNLQKDKYQYVQHDGKTVFVALAETPDGKTVTIQKLTNKEETFTQKQLKAYLERALKSAIYEAKPAKLEDFTRTLKLGHYCYVSYDGKLFLTAHVTKRDGKEIFIQKEIQKEPLSIDEELNSLVKNNEGILQP